MYMTKEEQESIYWTHQFLKSNKDAPFSIRKLLVVYFLEEWKEKVDIFRPIMRHPVTRKKSARFVCISDIMTDFLLDVDQVAERSEEYPIENPDKQARRENAQRANELSLVMDSERQDDDNYRMPPYSIDERALNGRDPIADIFFAEGTAESVEELITLLQEVKVNEDYNVNKYADESPWNAEQPDKRRTIKNVRKAIREIEINRVRECKECGGAFYAHDRRRHICDVQKYPGSNESACEVKNHRKRGIKPNLAQKKAII